MKLIRTHNEIYFCFVNNLLQWDEGESVWEDDSQQKNVEYQLAMH